MRSQFRALTAIQLLTAMALILILALFSGCTAMTGETVGQNLDDSRITAAVKTKLAGEKVSTLTRVGVETVQGTVHLTGIVDDTALRERATQLAWQVEGVRGVINNLQIKSS